MAIGFGRDVDAAFLSDLSQQNGGVWQQIFEGAEAAVQAGLLELSCSSII